MSVVTRRTRLRSHTSCQRGLGGRTITWIAQKKHLITKISTSVNTITLVACVRKILACTSHPTQNYVGNVLECIETVPVSTITKKTR